MRAARALLGWSAAEIADRARVTRFTIQRLEQHDGVPPSRSQTLEEIQRAFEAAGVEFIGTPDDKPGVRLIRPNAEAPRAKIGKKLSRRD